MAYVRGGMAYVRRGMAYVRGRDGLCEGEGRLM